MNKDEEEQLTTLIATNPGLQVTPQVLLQFIAMQTTMNQPQHSSPDNSPPPGADDAEEERRGRQEERDDDDGMNSRSSSRDSTATYHHRSSSRGPVTPRDSVFDTGKRQRTTPLTKKTATAPSSWARRPPPSRRKSDGGHSRALSDSEVRVHLSLRACIAGRSGPWIG